jgi:polyadenylate-binding protein
MNMDYHNMKKERPKKEKLEISTGTLRKILYIGELPPNTDQYFLYQLIMEKGNFTVDSITTKNTKDNKSYAYVKFGNEKEGIMIINLALKAKEILHLSNINGYVIRTNIFNKHLEKNDNLIGNLFIKNLPENLTSKELCDIFQEFGDISSIKLRQGVKGECQGQGYVQFSNELDAEKAMEKLNGSDIKGKQIVIEKFHEKKKRKMEGEDRSTIIFFQQLPISVIYTIISDTNRKPT